MNKELTPEEEILKKYETFLTYNTTPIFLKENVILAMKEVEGYYAAKMEEAINNILDAVLELHPEVNTGNDKEMKLYTAIHEYKQYKSPNQNPDNNTNSCKKPL